MKLLVAIVQDADVNALVEELTEKKYRLTKLSSSGGFLKAGNTTLLIGVEKERLDEALKIIEHNCKQREITTSLLTVTRPGDAFIPNPLEVKVGGANVFVIDVEQFVRI